MAKEHEVFLNTIFSKNTTKVIVAEKLGKLLCEKFPETTKANVRKIIENAYNSGIMKCSKPMTFGNNQYAYFSRKRAITYNLFKSTIKEYKPALYRVITKLFINGGIISENEIIRLSGCNISNTGHATTYENLLSDLRLLNIVNDINFHNVHLFYLSKWDKAKALIQLDSYYVKIMNEATMISLFVNWLRRVNLVDNSVITFRGEGNNFRGIEKNGTIWDIFAFSSSLGIFDYEKLKPAIIVADCCVYTEYDTIDFDGFRERVNRMVFSTKIIKRRVIPIIFSSKINPVVIVNAKKQNYLIVDLNSLFGKEAINIVTEYNNIKFNYDSTIVAQGNNSQQIESVLSRIEQSSGGDNYGNLKGDLFEYLMRPVFEKIYPTCRIKHRVLINDGDGKYEIDYLIDNDNEYIAVELKGYKFQYVIPLGKFETVEGRYESNTVKWFLNRTFPKFKEVFGKMPNKKVKFSYIISAQFDDKALKVLAQKNCSSEKPEKMNCYYDGITLGYLLKELALDNEMRILK